MTSVDEINTDTVADSRHLTRNPSPSLCRRAVLNKALGAVLSTPEIRQKTAPADFAGSGGRTMVETNV